MSDKIRFVDWVELEISRIQEFEAFWDAGMEGLTPDAFPGRMTAEEWEDRYLLWASGRA